MRVDRCGESLFIIREVVGRPSDLANWIGAQDLPGVLEAVAAYATVGVHTIPKSWTVHQLIEAIQKYEPSNAGEGTSHRIPVCYELGLDIHAVCEMLSVSFSQLVELHTTSSYTCEAVGFCPGFPYLSGLHSTLCGLPRRGEPRLRVPAGSIGITGAQCGVYPADVPGGWNLIGQTPLIICDPAHQFFPIQAGDHIQFDPMSKDAFDAWSGQRLGVRP